MARQFRNDPTEFFSVVGAPYVRERGGHDQRHHQRQVPEFRTDDLRPRTLEIGVATVCVAFCAVALGVSLFAGSGAAKLIEVAHQTVK